MGEKSRLDFGDSSPENSLTHGGTAVAEKTTGRPTDVKPDFSGWATKYGIECSDGRTINPEAFAHQDKVKVPLVWQHGHEDAQNVLGHVYLDHRDEGVYAYGYFNETDSAKHAKQLIEHEDIDSLSIFANKLKERAKKVAHGLIREVSLVMARANPGALIDNLELQHSDGGLVTIEDEAVIYNGETTLKHGDDADEQPETPVETPKDGDDEAEDNGEQPEGVQKVYDEMSDEQKEVVHYFVGAALNSNAAEDDGDNDLTHDENNGGTRTMKRNVFETQNGGSSTEEAKHELSHDDIRGIAADAVQMGSLKAAVESYALKHGIEDIDVLFPDARTVTSTPEFDKRRTEWVSAVIGGTNHSPFSRIKSIVADITVEEARALGYIKGSFKKEEFFGLVKRITTPTTVYKKQKLDRDDIIDITDFDVVTWLKSEMRLMLDEELARAILVSDGRAIDNDDKIRDPAGVTEGAGIRSIINDHDLYALKVELEDAVTLLDTDPVKVVDAITTAMGDYKGSGQPTFFTTLPRLTKMLLARDNDGRRYYRTASDLAAELGVDRIVPVEVMETQADLIGIIVNLRDYTVGADRGGDVSMFDDFDIDYNQYKYLIETRVSGALTKIRSALVITSVNELP